MTTQPQSRLLCLPAELRIQIYTLLLSPPHLATIRRISSRGYCSDYVLPPLSLTPSLLGTCRQINDEATPILYGQNTFAAHQSLLTDLPYLVTNSKPVTRGRGKELIKRWYVNVRLDTDARYTAEKARDAFTGVESLCIDVFQAMFGGCDFSALKLFEGVRGVRQCTIQGSVGDGRYARWLEAVVCKGVGEEVAEFVEMDEEDAPDREQSPLRSQVRDIGDAWLGDR
ncbi:hypothetical protein MBLNU457_3900t1 [Dothideomycetes sp. NU457]